MTFLQLPGATGGKGKKKKKKKKDENKENPDSRFAMFVKKNFGNQMKKGENYEVFARIVELTPEGQEIARDDLTARIECFSGDSALYVQSGGMKNGYMAAQAQVPDDCKTSKGQVSFRFSGRGGTFIRHVEFQLSEAYILFGQENMGLPANKLKYAFGGGKNKNLGDGSYRLPFRIFSMVIDKDTKISAELELKCVTDNNGKVMPIEDVRKNGIPYTVTVEPDPEDADKGIYLAVIKETGTYELPAGSSEGFILTVKAERGMPGTREYVAAETEFPVYRIHMGLVLTLESASIPCYMVLKPGKDLAVARRRSQIAQAAELRMANEQEYPDAMAIADRIDDLLAAEEVNPSGFAPGDFEPRFAIGSLILFLCRESDMSIVRVPVTPNKDITAIAKKVANDRYCHTGDANESHQALVDKLGLRVDSTGILLDNGAHKLKFCASKAALEAPVRIIAEITLKATYEGKEYEVKQDVLLRSQEFRVPENSDDERKFIELDNHVEERLLNIHQNIWDNHYLNQLFALDNMINRMIDGHDYRFGYDENQIKNIMSMWVGFIRGDFAGANGTPKGVTLADELTACYAFLQGLRDNTGFLGRVAMGVMTAGYSEYVFSTMTLAEEMQRKVFECKGDKDFGFWDGVEMGVTEFGKTALIQAGMQLGVGAAAKGLKAFNIDVAAKMSQWGTAYRTTMDKWNVGLRNNSKLYKMGDDALQKTLNFFNSQAAAAKAAMDEAEKAVNEAEGKINKMLNDTRNEMSPAQLKQYEEAMEEGFEQLGALKKAQQAMEAATDPATLKAAQAHYRECANIVWRNKNALKQLQSNSNPYAQRMRAQFNRYRETLLDKVQEEAMDDITKATGIPREDLYVMNASNGVKTEYAQGLSVPGDRDISIKQKVHSDPSRASDLTINQSVGQEAVAKRLFKKLKGREPRLDEIDQAMQLMDDMDVTYVHPEKDSAARYVFQHNLEAYEDLPGMVGIGKDGKMNKGNLKNDLHNKKINQAAVSHKGMEWIERADKGIEQAAKLEAEAVHLTGAAKESALAQAKSLRNLAQGQTCEGIRQITKQVTKIIVPRGLARYKKVPLSPKAIEIHQLALRVGKDVAPVEFEYILKKIYKMDLNGYCNYMASFLD